MDSKQTQKQKILVRIVIPLAPSNSTIDSIISSLPPTSEWLKEFGKKCSLAKFNVAGNSASFSLDGYLESLDRVLGIEKSNLQETIELLTKENNTLNNKIKELGLELDQCRQCNCNLVIAEEDLKGENNKFKEEKKDLLQKLQSLEQKKTNVDEILEKANKAMSHFSEKEKIMEEKTKILEEKTKILEENKKIMEDNYNKSQEIEKLQRALVNTYDDYGGITARVILERFYDFFLQRHEELNCEEHASLYHDLARKQANKGAISEHWCSCSKIEAERKNFFVEFSKEINDLNFQFNRYVHRSKVREVIVPKSNDFNEKVLVAIYEFESKLFNSKVLQSGEGELKIIKIKASKPANQVIHFQHYIDS